MGLTGRATARDAATIMLGIKSEDPPQSIRNFVSVRVDSDLCSALFQRPQRMDVCKRIDGMTVEVGVKVLALVNSFSGVEFCPSGEHFWVHVD